MKCSAQSSIQDRVFRSSDPTGHCDWLNVKLSCDKEGSYSILLATEDCSHSGYSSTATTTFTPSIHQQSGNLTLLPTWTASGDGCGGGRVVNLLFNYFCPLTGDCRISFTASCNDAIAIYKNTFNFSSLTTKKYNYSYNQGCKNEK